MEAGESACRIALPRSLDQDHLGPEIRHQQGGIRARVLLGQADDPQAGQGQLVAGGDIMGTHGILSAHRPRQTGLRFSMNAPMPSAASSASMLRTTSSPAYS